MDYSLIAEALEYDPQTGVFTWKSTTKNKKKEGSIAGHLSKKTGYIILGFNNQSFLAHRVAWYMVYGDLPEVIDHIDRNRSNNAIWNLRSVSKSENGMNTNISKRNISGYKNVYWSNRRSRWVVEVIAYGKKFYGGQFLELGQAHDKAEELRKSLHKEFFSEG